METILALAVTGIVILALIPWIIDTVVEYREERKRQAQESYALSKESSNRSSYEDISLRRYLIGPDPNTKLGTPPYSVCYEVIRLLEEDLDGGIARLSQYYKVPVPKVEINEALLKAHRCAGMYTDRTIYLTFRPKIKTVLHEFAHYLMEFRDYLPDKDLREILADMFASDVIRKAASYWESEAEVDMINSLKKRTKRWEKDFRRSLEKTFPNHPEIVEELLRVVGIDEDEEEEEEE